MTKISLTPPWEEDDKKKASEKGSETTPKNSIKPSSDKGDSTETPRESTETKISTPNMDSIQTEAQSIFNEVLSEDAREKTKLKTDPTVITTEQIVAIVNELAKQMSMNSKDAQLAIIMLLAYGACNTKIPPSFSVDVGEFTVSKNDLLYSYEKVTKNKFLRRLAETLALVIGQFCEKYRISGDLVSSMEKSIRSKREDTKNNAPLTPREKAYAHSFAQKLDLSFVSERMNQLMSEDYDKRFSNKKSKETNTNQSKKTKKGKKQKKQQKGGKAPKKDKES